MENRIENTMNKMEISKEVLKLNVQKSSVAVDAIQAIEKTIGKIAEAGKKYGLLKERLGIK